MTTYIHGGSGFIYAECQAKLRALHQLEWEAASATRNADPTASNFEHAKVIKTYHSTLNGHGDGCFSSSRCRAELRAQPRAKMAGVPMLVFQHMRPNVQNIEELLDSRSFQVCFSGLIEGYAILRSAMCISWAAVTNSYNVMANSSIGEGAVG